MVVDDVEDHREPGVVRGGDERREARRAAVGGVRAPRCRRRRSPSRGAPGNSATGMISIAVTPSSRELGAGARIAASNVPSGVNVPTCSS